VASGQHGIMILSENNLTNDEARLLRSSNFSFRAITKKEGGAQINQAVWCTLPAVLLYILLLIALSNHRWPVTVVCGAAALAIMAIRVAPLAVLIASIAVGRLQKPVYRKALIYWSWWPAWNFILCCVAWLAACILGRYLWHSNVEPWYKLSQLQHYDGLDPAVVPGEQVQDAGLVTFTPMVGIDHSRGSCFKQAGHSYCVAPILHGGKVPMNMAGASQTGTYDFFAIGVDCCSCPNFDFQCGEWNNPSADGGMRLTDASSRPWYKLAADQWSAAYRKDVKHPLFFHWVQAPKFCWKLLWNQANNIMLISTFALAAIFLVLALLLAKVLQLLASRDIVSQLWTPAPPRGLEGAWAIALPEVLQHYLSSQQQLLGLPVGPMPWYDATGRVSYPRSAGPPEPRIGALPPGVPLWPGAADRPTPVYGPHIPAATNSPEATPAFAMN